ncbi:MAG TPA: DUF4349 domain-containing protein [Leptospiraceae bacterium]|nr:DUF4349 domain-containing protein [Leptospiraceae bacterium]HMW06933.1 DUF4349 domain-containing protein [Leptospiraceae bacterium]HMX32295.1 DUF4349 domain-containing protein [Leptospiraceae bacterium]HMY33463.1 DUF4349 domain-containing protein [Leptospiraceae bacterium]HMZ65496.1 DUF4349 domain-containing protein [Leptospiraceae bacterium]
MRNALIIFSFILILFCKQKEVTNAEVAQAAPKAEKKDFYADGTVADEEETIGGNKQRKESEEVKNIPGNLDKPLNPITDAAKTRFLEYNIQLSYKVEDINKTRENLLNIVKKDSFISRSQTNLSTGYESMFVQIYIPVGTMYQTLVELDKLGQLTYEDIQTEDLTDKNEEQKIKLSRESIRGSRRSRVANKGSVENWNWKDREDALERSENAEDQAKLESWRIKDRVSWAKVNLTLSGKELSNRIQFPNYKNAFVSAINFLLEISYSLVWLVPVLALGFILFKLYRKIRR